MTVTCYMTITWHMTVHVKVTLRAYTHTRTHACMHTHTHTHTYQCTLCPSLLIQVPETLSSCSPVARQPCFLYVFHLKSATDGVYYQQCGGNRVDGTVLTFGILSRSKLVVSMVSVCVCVCVCVCYTYICSVDYVGIGLSCDCGCDCVMRHTSDCHITCDCCMTCDCHVTYNQ